MTRYIETSEATAVIADYFDLICDTEFMFDETEILRRMNANAIDAVPVKHGKWIRQTDTRFGEMLNDILICSECNVAFSTVSMIRRSYCPNCGARMDKE